MALVPAVDALSSATPIFVAGGAGTDKNASLSLTAGNGGGGSGGCTVYPTGNTDLGGGGFTWSGGGGFFGDGSGNDFGTVDAGGLAFVNGGRGGRIQISGGPSWFGGFGGGGAYGIQPTGIWGQNCGSNGDSNGGSGGGGYTGGTDSGGSSYGVTPFTSSSVSNIGSGYVKMALSNVIALGLPGAAPLPQHRFDFSAGADAAVTDTGAVGGWTAAPAASGLPGSIVSTGATAAAAVSRVTLTAAFDAASATPPSWLSVFSMGGLSLSIFPGPILAANGVLVSSHGVVVNEAATCSFVFFLDGTNATLAACVPENVEGY